MDIVIINGSPRHPSESNTAGIIARFRRGLDRAGVSSEVFCLSDRGQWSGAMSAFLHGRNIIFAFPIFNGGVPGSVMEFMELLAACPNLSSAERRVSFALQSGFPEACHRRCCESFLETLPEQLGSRFAGILSHGTTFNLTFGDTPAALLSYETMGELFVRHDCTFFFPEAADFNSPEYITETEAKMYNRIFRFFCQRTAEAQGCTQDLSHKPYMED